ncbi:DUF7527 domain-containing protein [Halovivax limisalsi]|uniref:DUF7527 domain-containing protein n=1 Tax=Halovivax limisalsi TaxID=1453760 RepID=UPI001FFCF165|nr:hypothetical protein [Halovivax limisalsi]
MDSRTQARVERWESRPFDGDELPALADADFSGAVTAAGTWLFVLNGRVVGVVDGRITDVHGTSGTIYEAPEDVLPLLLAMLETGGESRGTYYTNETSLAEVDRTLQQGSFTGYVELSEQVLSGDYYAVYYGGKRMSAAYIGNAERLVTGEEAFERADDEVGLYEVVDVDVEVTDVPGHRDSAAAPTSDADGSRSGPATATDSTATNDASAGASDGGNGAPASGAETDATVDARGDAASASSDPSADDAADPTGTDQSQATGGEPVDPLAESAPDPGSAAAEDPEGTTPDPTADSGSDSVVAAEPTSDASDGVTTDAASRTGATEPADASDQSPGGESSEDSATGSEPVADDAATAAGRSESFDETDIGPDEGDGDAAAGASEATGTGRDASPANRPAPGAGDRADADGRAEPDDRPDADDPTGHADPGADRAAGPRTGAEPEADASEGEHDERFKEEARWRETRQIPSIDPENSRPDPSAGRERRAPSERSQTTEPARPADGQSPEPAEGADTGSVADGSATDTVASTDRALRSDMLEREDKIDRLTQRVTEIEAEKDELEAERDRLAGENEELRERIADLESQLRSLEAERDSQRASAGGHGSRAGSAGVDGSPETGSPAATGSATLTPAEALAGTNVFVRYASKSQPTLEAAHDGDGSRSDVVENLQLERHTGFDASRATVGDASYDEFLEGTVQYRFVRWLVETALFEIRETGNAAGLADLYDAIPRIDRVELDATISLEDDDTENVPDRVTFDLAAFDKRGTPLVVANCNDSRDPADRSMLESLEAEASAVCANYPALGGAVAVTSSFFEPGALEFAEEATSSGLLNRSSKRSHVSLSRKQGYHFCLVESRSGGFHVTVPEL